MEEQRARARAAWAGSGEAATERVWFELKEKVGATEFLGYTTETAEAEIVALVRERRAGARQPRPGTEVAVVLNQTPFYGESGGQVGDTGTITGADGLRIAVTDTQRKLGDLFVHLGRVEAGEARVGTAVRGGGGPCAAHDDPRAPLGDASAARGAAAAARHACHAEGQPERARPAALRHLPAASDDRRGNRLGRGRGECAHPREHRGDDAADDAGRRGRNGRDGAVRGEIRRRGARRRDGRRRGQQGGVFDRAVRRHACAAHRRHRLFQDRLRGRGGRRRAAHRGGDRRVRRGAGGGDAASAERRRRGVARQPGRCAGTGRRAAGGACAGWSARWRSCSASWRPAAAAPRWRR